MGHMYLVINEFKMNSNDIRSDWANNKRMEPRK